MGRPTFIVGLLQALLDLEKELIAFATQLGFKFELRAAAVAQPGGHARLVGSL